MVEKMEGRESKNWLKKVTETMGENVRKNECKICKKKKKSG